MTQQHNPPGTLAFIDVETTSTHPARRAWEIAVVVRRPDAATVEEFHTFVDASHIELEHADQRALDVGRFHARHPQMTARPDVIDAVFGAPIGVLDEYTAMRQVEWMTRGAQLVAWNVSFDAQTIDARMRAVGLSPSFDYHHIEVSALAAGYLTAYDNKWRQPAAEFEHPRPIWTRSEILTALGVDEPAKDVAHTALGDAKWHMAVYDRVMNPGGEHVPPGGGENVLANIAGRRGV